MMLVVDFFESFGMKMNGGFWILSKEYCDPTEELGGRVFGTNGCCTAKQYAQKMGGYMKYVQPILDSQIAFDALVEKTEDIVRAKGPTSLQDLNKAMVTTGEKPNRRIGKTEFLAVLTSFGATWSDGDQKLMDENLCFETNGLVDYDKFWTGLSGEGFLPQDHRKLSYEIIKEW